MKNFIKFLNHISIWKVSDLLLFGTMLIYLFLSFFLYLKYKIDPTYVSVSWLFYMILLLISLYFNLGKISKWLLKKVDIKIWIVLIYMIIFTLSSLSFLFIK